jgi:Na+/proline symporter
VIIGVAGLILIGISLYQLYDALSGGFLDETKTEQMNRRERRAFIGLGKVGLTARALVFVLIGYFVLRTAIEYNPANAVGVDGALARLHHQPFGPWIVGLVGVGLLMFAAFSFFEGRYRRL